MHSFQALKRIFVFILTGSAFFFYAFAYSQPPQEALFYELRPGKAVQCFLCPRRCPIAQGTRGSCGVRENQGGVLYTLSYAKLVSANDFDPVEKKPLFHFLPGSRTFSIATAGCNMSCKFCQNWEISQKKPEEVEFNYVSPKELVEKVIASGRPILAFTYTEPTIFYEYMLEAAQLAKRSGIRTCMHSNGYINEEPLRRLAKYLDAANIDLKGFKEEYYAKVCGGSLAPVLATLKVLKEEGVHIELTTLILPGFNDDEASLRELCGWVKNNLGPDTPIHFSRFFPMYKLVGLNPTPVDTLKQAHKIALECGLRYVYIGNLSGSPAENTFCPKCGKIVIARSGYIIKEIHLNDGKCAYCGEVIKGVWQ